MAEHPLKGKWIVHYYGDQPWQSISDLDEETGNAIAAQSGKTFDGSYHRRRREIEQWDREQHSARGGVIGHANPVYAILCDSIPERHPHQGTWIAIPAESVPADVISLSLGDSFIAYDIAQGRADPAGRLSRSWSAEALMQELGSGPLPDGWPEHVDAGENPFYVEARLYTRALPTAQAAAFARAAFVSLNAQSIQGSTASTSDASTVAPHQMRRPAGAAL